MCYIYVSIILMELDCCVCVYAQVADFGLARLAENDVTHVSTRVMGTFG